MGNRFLYHLALSFYLFYVGSTVKTRLPLIPNSGLLLHRNVISNASLGKYVYSGVTDM